MRFILFSLFFLLASSGFSQSNAFKTYCQELESERKETYRHLKSKKESPFRADVRKAFIEPQYFAPDSTWRLQATFHIMPAGAIIEIPTSAGKTKKFQEYGIVEFHRPEGFFTLIAYRLIYPEGTTPPAEETLFLLFTDLCTGEACYGGGRYLDIPMLADGSEITLDFNRCYNPYCAYSTGFSCPIPPATNFLNCEVRAGEKAYPGAVH